MMTGIVSVSSLYLIYRILTLVFLHLFGVYDFRHHLIKNTALVFLSLWCLFGILLKLILGIAPSLPLLIFKACLGGSVGFFLLLIIAVATNGGIGGGDIKLGTVLGLYYGVFGLFQILILSGTAAIFAALPLRLQYKSKPTAIPFAPFLFLGCLFYEILSLF